MKQPTAGAPSSGGYPPPYDRRGSGGTYEDRNWYYQPDRYDYYNYYRNRYRMFGSIKCLSFIVGLVISSHIINHDSVCFHLFFLSCTDDLTKHSISEFIVYNCSNYFTDRILLYYFTDMMIVDHSTVVAVIVMMIVMTATIIIGLFMGDLVLYRMVVPPVPVTIGTILERIRDTIMMVGVMVMITETRTIIISRGVAVA